MIDQQVIAELLRSCCLSAIERGGADAIVILVTGRDKCGRTLDIRRSEGNVNTIIGMLQSAHEFSFEQAPEQTPDGDELVDRLLYEEDFSDEDAAET
ncbi:MAG: hypothetical protein N2111_14270 [Candidatus Sumerlaeaceae bacterium]|nr:hypothetical protein [Candidatus Sumerlaeaceae bacterium]